MASIWYSLAGDSSPHGGTVVTTVAYEHVILNLSYEHVPLVEIIGVVGVMTAEY